MSHMTREITIAYNWECEELGDTEMPYDMISELERHTKERVHEMQRDEYTSGELCYNVYADIEGFTTPENGWECTGWWSLREVNV